MYRSQTILVIALVAVSSSVAQGQEVKQSDKVTVTKYFVAARTKLQPEEQRVSNDFDDEKDALARKKEFDFDHSPKGLLAADPLISSRVLKVTKLVDRRPTKVEQAKDLFGRLKEAKEAVDRGKRAAKGDEPLLRASERKLGDTTKEYKDTVAKSFAQVTDAKKTLTGGVTSLTDAKFRQVNGLIDKYNREVTDFQSVMGKDANLGFSPLARVEPFDPKKARADVVGTWKGVSVEGDSRLGYVVVFNDDGTVSARSEKGGTGIGTWSRDGDTITIMWSSNGVKVSWQLKDSRLGGSGTTSRDQPWSMSLRKQ